MVCYEKKINLQCEIAFELKIQNQQTIYQEACDTVRCCNSLCENRQSIFFCSRPWQSLQRVYPTYFAVVMIESLKCAKYYCGKMALRKKKWFIFGNQRSHASSSMSTVVDTKQNVLSSAGGESLLKY